MNVTDNNSREGIEAGLADLIRVRPDRALTGFAPGGRVSTHQFELAPHCCCDGEQTVLEIPVATTISQVLLLQVFL